MDQLTILFKKYLNNECTIAEIELLLQYFGADRYHTNLKRLIIDHLKQEEAELTFDEYELDARLGNIYKVLKDDITRTQAPPVKTLWSRIAVAAAIFIVLSAGIYFFKVSQYSGRAEGRIDIVSNDIKPGKNTATLRLGNGKTINLNETKNGVAINALGLKYNDGSFMEYPVETRSLSTEEKLTAATPRGGTYQFTLSDGTKVWMNADSKIEFPAQFSGKERRIKLSGEAYFEVATSYVSLQGQKVKQPFIVVTDQQEVEVLGTHFNINSYADEAGVKTTLLEGSVKVTSLAGTKQSSILKPKQQALLTGNTIAVTAVDPEKAIAWKTGFFQFEDASVETVLRELARWYDVEVIYNGQMPERLFTGKIYRNLTAAEALRIMKFTNVNFKIEGRKIIVTP